MRPAGVTSPAVPPAMAGSQATRRVMTTNSWRSSAAAIAARTWPWCSGLSVRVVRCWERARAAHGRTAGVLFADRLPMIT
jgi:hypothetical protein